MSISIACAAKGKASPRLLTKRSPRRYQETARISSDVADNKGDSRMTDRLMGLETEYALTVSGPSEEEQLAEAKAKAVRALLKLASRETHLPALNHKGLFFANGSLLYLDCGDHLEYSTPECLSPQEVIRHQWAGERFLAGLVKEVSVGGGQVSEVALFKHNVDYARGSYSSWGCHESYLHRADVRSLSKQLIPFLVSRIVFTGAGGFHPLRPNLQFLISPRVAFLVRTVSSSSTTARGIFHTKDEPLCKDFQRLHLICGESNCSETALFLKLGTTALVVAMDEAGVRPGNAVQLRQPLRAMRMFSQDLECTQTALTTNGKRLTAIEIQRHYLASAEAHSQEAFMPPWAEEVIKKWQWILDHFEQGGPDGLVGVLDWPLKLAVFRDYVRRRGFPWEKIVKGSRTPSERDAATKKSTTAKDGPRLRLQNELLEIDMRFSQLGELGIFAALERAGCLQHRVRGVDNIEAAMTTPPMSGRARLRGKAVERFGKKKGYYCCWDRLYDTNKHRVADLSNPFESQERWKKLPKQVERMPLFRHWIAGGLNEWEWPDSR